MNLKSPILPILAGMLAVGLLALAIALAESSETEGRNAGPEPLVTAVGGGFHRLPGEADAVFAANGLEPGQSATGTARLRNSGSSPGLFTLSRTGLSDRPGPNGGRLSERLQLEVLDVTEPGNPAVVYTGGVGALDLRPLGVLTPDASRSYEVRATALTSQTSTVPLGGGDPYEGSSTRISFRWRAIEGLPPSRLTSLLRTPDRLALDVRLSETPRQAVIESGR